MKLAFVICHFLFFSSLCQGQNYVYQVTNSVNKSVGYTTHEVKGGTTIMYDGVKERLLATTIRSLDGKKSTTVLFDGSVQIINFAVAPEELSLKSCTRGISTYKNESSSVRACMTVEGKLYGKEFIGIELIFLAKNGGKEIMMTFHDKYNPSKILMREQIIIDKKGEVIRYFSELVFEI